MGMPSPAGNPVAHLHAFEPGSGVSLHPDVAPLAFLLGTWQGEGTGEYPTIEPFAYGEEIVLSHLGKPYLAYSQRTWSLEDGTALHCETGYLRLCGPAPRRLEAVIAHATGITETAEGVLEPGDAGAASGRLELISTRVSSTSTAKNVTAVGRSIQIDGDQLRYRLRMAYGGLPAHHHLSAELAKVV